MFLSLANLSCFSLYRSSSHLLKDSTPATFPLSTLTTAYHPSLLDHLHSHICCNLSHLKTKITFPDSTFLSDYPHSLSVILIKLQFLPFHSPESTATKLLLTLLKKKKEKKLKLIHSLHITTGSICHSLLFPPP